MARATSGDGAADQPDGTEVSAPDGPVSRRLDDGDWHRRSHCLVAVDEAGIWSTDETRLYENLCQAIAMALDCDDVFMHLLTTRGEAMVRYGRMPDGVDSLSEWGDILPLGVGRISLILDQVKPILMDYDHPHDLDRIPPVASEQGYRCAASVPLLADGAVLGMYSAVFRRQVDWTDDDLEYLQVVGRIAGTAVNRARSARKHSQLILLEERRRLSNEIHDNVSHLLGSLSLCAASVLESYGEHDDQALTRGLEKLDDICSETMRVFRDEMLSLRAPLERTEEWLESIRGILENFQHEWGIVTCLQTDILNEPLSLNLQCALHLTRILNECLSNSLRHAHANRVSVSLFEDGRIIRLSVEDDGGGFDIAKVAPERLGLKIMKERASAMEGTLDIRSSSRGTIVTVEVPRLSRG